MTPHIDQPSDMGTARFIGQETWIRCAAHFGIHGARLYELARPLTETAPQSPFADALNILFKETDGVPSTIHAHNGEQLMGSPTQQGTHLDALGHFGFLPSAWNGNDPFPADTVSYYGGLSQTEVKPEPKKGLRRLGVETVPPIVTSAVLLDASKHLAGGKILQAGHEISPADIESMLNIQGLGNRGILPGDALLIHTGWGAHWQDPDDGAYYESGPGLSRAAAEYVSKFSPALIALDNPFTDPVNRGQLRGRNVAPPGMLPNAPFGTHHQNLVKAGILQMQNLYLTDLAKDHVFLSGLLILPLLLQGASGSPVRPIAIGAPSTSSCYLSMEKPNVQ